MYHNQMELFLISCFLYWSRKINVYPKGQGSGKGKSLSVFLYLDNCGSLPTKVKLYVEFSVLVKDQVNGNHCEMKGEHLPSIFNLCSFYRDWETGLSLFSF